MLEKAGLEYFSESALFKQLSSLNESIIGPVCVYVYVLVQPNSENGLMLYDQ